MPTYANISTTVNPVIKNIYDREIRVAPGESVETYEDLSADANFNETSSSPNNAITATAQNTFTDGVRVRKGIRQLNMSISGIADSTVTLQRSEDGGVIYKDVQQFTSDQESYIIDAADDTIYRLGVKTGDYVSGTIVVKLGK